MSIRTMAAHTGRDRGHLSKLERGKAGASDETLRRIADALRVPTDAIATEEMT